jgi:hypothetical protein
MPHCNIAILAYMNIVSYIESVLRRSSQTIPFAFRSITNAVPGFAGALLHRAPYLAHIGFHPTLSQHMRLQHLSYHSIQMLTVKEASRNVMVAVDARSPGRRRAVTSSGRLFLDSCSAESFLIFLPDIIFICLLRGRCFQERPSGCSR